MPEVMRPLQKHMDAIRTRLLMGPATGPELAEIQWRFSATIYALREQGYKIKTSRLHGRIWQYELLPN